MLGQKINIGIWDTSGSERYEPISKLYYKTAQAAILCYDPKDIDSYHKLIFWLNEISENEPSTKLYICATKIDLVNLFDMQILPYYCSTFTPLVLSYCL